MSDSVKVRKISVSLPAELVNDLNYISHALGVSRSAFLSASLAQSLPMLRETVQGIGVDLVNSDLSDADVIRRYRSNSKAQIDSMLKSISGSMGELQGDLFNGR